MKWINALECGPDFEMLVMEGRIVVVDLGASRLKFANRSTFDKYQQWHGVNVYTASGEVIPDSV